MKLGQLRTLITSLIKDHGSGSTVSVVYPHGNRAKTGPITGYAVLNRDKRPTIKLVVTREEDKP
jgi:hypothetical protein